MRALLALLLLAGLSGCGPGCLPESDAYGRGLGPRRIVSAAADMTTAATYDTVVAADSASLRRYWRLLDGAVANAGSIVESSGFAGGPYTATAAGAWASAASIVTGDATALNNNAGGSNSAGTFTTTGALTDFTACFWLKLPTGVIDYQLGVLSVGGCGGTDATIWGNGGTVSFSTNGSTNTVSDPNAKDTNRHFYCLVRSGSSVHLWVDNVDASSGTNSTSVSFVRFGGSGCGTAKELTLSEVEIHNAALNSTRIGARWTAGQ